MKIACLCSTFNRPDQLAEAIECFQRQTYPLEQRELIILDDAGQYDQQTGPGWWLLSVGKRFRTLGEKRNATAALASADVDAFAVWDDDDIYLPGHLKAMAEVFRSGVPWSLPDEIWVDRRDHLDHKQTNGLFHGAWGFTRDAFLSVGAYPAMQSGQDQALGVRLEKARIPHASPSGPPSFIYRWHTYTAARHLSAMGKGGYERRGSEPITRHRSVTPCWSRDWARLAVGAS